MKEKEELGNVDPKWLKEELLNLQSACEDLSVDGSFDEEFQKKLLSKKLQVALINLDPNEVSEFYAGFYKEHVGHPSKILLLDVDYIKSVFGQKRLNNLIVGNGHGNPIAQVQEEISKIESVIFFILKPYRDLEQGDTITKLPRSIYNKISILTKHIKAMNSSLEELQN